MFSVFGVTDAVLKKAASKKVAYDKKLSPEENEKLVIKAYEALLKKKKPVILTPEFSSPQMAESALVLLSKEVGAEKLAVYIKSFELKTVKGKSKVARKWVKFDPKKKYKTQDELMGHDKE